MKKEEIKEIAKDVKAFYQTKSGKMLLDYIVTETGDGYPGYCDFAEILNQMIGNEHET